MEKRNVFLLVTHHANAAKDQTPTIVSPAILLCGFITHLVFHNVQQMDTTTTLLVENVEPVIQGVSHAMEAPTLHA